MRHHGVAGLPVLRGARQVQPGARQALLGARQALRGGRQALLGGAAADQRIAWIPVTQSVSFEIALFRESNASRKRARSKTEPAWSLVQINGNPIRPKPGFTVGRYTVTVD